MTISKLVRILYDVATPSRLPIMPIMGHDDRVLRLGHYDDIAGER